MPDRVVGGLLLPPRGAMPKPDADDPLDYYYRPLTARVYRGRLPLALELAVYVVCRCRR